MKSLESLVKYDLALSQMLLSSFHCHFKVCSSKATLQSFLSSVDKFRLQMIDTKKIALWQTSKALLLPSKANAFIATKRRPRLQIMGDDARSLVNTSKLRKPQLECWRCFASSGLQVDLQWTGWRLYAETEWTLVNLHKSKIGSSVSLRLHLSSANYKQKWSRFALWVYESNFTCIKRKSPMLQCCCAFHQWLLEYEASWMRLSESKSYGEIHFDPKHRRITTRCLYGCVGTSALHVQSVFGLMCLWINEYLQWLFYEV